MMCLSIILPILTNDIMLLKSNRKGVFVSQLGGYLTSYAPSLQKASEYLNDKPVFSTYASALETMTDQFQPTGMDYIIHVLGDKAREKYIKDFVDNKYEYAQTIKSQFTPYEFWIRNANWFFYRILYKNYNISFDTIYSYIWKRSETPNVINASATIKIEKLSASKYHYSVP